jgi:hypothetical protein
MTLEEYLPGHWLPAKEDTVTATTHARYVTSVQHYLLPHLGRVPLRRLHPDDLDALYRHLLRTGNRRGGPLGAKTIHNLHQIIRAALNDAVNRRLLPIKPAEQVHPPDPRKHPSGRRQAGHGRPLSSADS